ncbi:TetR family transcriptional regulator [Pseudomonas fluorescens BRIP34879]|nr:TetR family transcriptional regulator [Pseudomonas fluorescens BRIP34879]
MQPDPSYDLFSVDLVRHTDDLHVCHRRMSKEELFGEIVLSHTAALPDAIAEAVAHLPADAPLLELVEGALVEMVTRYQTPQLRALARLIRDTPTLSAGDQAKYDKVERALAKALANRKDVPEDDIACRVAAATAIGILKLAVEAWLSGPDAGPGPFCEAAFAALKNVVTKA